MLVPEENRIGEEGDGFKIAMATLDRSRLGIAAQAVGIAQGALDAAVPYAAEREQFGQRVADFQGIQFMLADMASQTEAARQLDLRRGRGVDAAVPDVPYWTSTAKLIAGDTAMRVTTDAVQVLGGYGYISEYPVERMMRDAKITQLYEGTQQIQRLVDRSPAPSAERASRSGRGSAGRPEREDRRLPQAGPGHDRGEAVHAPTCASTVAAAEAVINPLDEYAIEQALAPPGGRAPSRRWLPVDGPRAVRPRRCAAHWRWAETRPPW